MKPFRGGPLRPTTRSLACGLVHGGSPQDASTVDQRRGRRPSPSLPCRARSSRRHSPMSSSLSRPTTRPRPTPPTQRTTLWPPSLAPLPSPLCPTATRLTPTSSAATGRHSHRGKSAASDAAAASSKPAGPSSLPHRPPPPARPRRRRRPEPRPGGSQTSAQKRPNVQPDGGGSRARITAIGSVNCIFMIPLRQRTVVELTLSR